MKIKVPPQILMGYKIPSMLTPFQLTMYKHLIDYKKEFLTKLPGYYKGIEYDAIIPEDLKARLYPLYPPLLEELEKHKFKPHKHLGSHMASSQTACLNLFLPILMNAKTANVILPKINPSFKELAVDHMKGGFKFEFFSDDNPLKDHTDAAGTDSDVAIAYYDKAGLLSLWLIEHKLTEDDFTACGGYKSKGNKNKSYCKNRTLILSDNSKCYYNYHCGYKYWQITNRSDLYEFGDHILDNIKSQKKCPFADGKNQLWRNQLLGFAIQEKGEYKNVHFSVVHHEDNHELESTIADYRRILKRQDIFSTFTSADIIREARLIKDKFIREWEEWYSSLYLCK